MQIRNFLLAILLIFPLIKVQSQTSDSNPIPILAEEKTVTSCPFLTKDVNGVPVISFGKEINENEAVICYSLFDFNANKFQNPIEIPTSKGVDLHGENMPKIIFKPNNEIIAVWGINNPSEKKKYGGLVNYSQSFDNGKSWTKATSLVKDTASIDQRYFDIDLLPNGEVAVIWLDNRSKTDTEGSTLYYAETNGILGFVNEKPIAETTCQCCRTDLFVSKNGTINTAFRDIIDGEIRDMVLTYSSDNGNTFSVPARISPDNWKIKGCPHTGPTMTESENGLHFAWYTSGGGAGVFYSNSQDDGNHFSKRDIVCDNPTSKHPQITSLNNQDILIVWDEAKEKKGVFTSQIGLQHRKNDGKTVSTRYISPKKENATFPVIEAINKNQLVVAWSQNSESVFYKIISLD